MHLLCLYVQIKKENYRILSKFSSAHRIILSSAVESGEGIENIEYIHTMNICPVKKKIIYVYTLLHQGHIRLPYFTLDATIL